MNTMLNGSMTLAQREPGPTGPTHTKGDGGPAHTKGNDDTRNKVRVMKSILIVIACYT